MTQPEQSDIEAPATADQVHRTIYTAVTDLGYSPTAAAIASGAVVWALEHPQEWFNLRLKADRDRVAASRRK